MIQNVRKKKLLLSKWNDFAILFIIESLGITPSFIHILWSPQHHIIIIIAVVGQFPPIHFHPGYLPPGLFTLQTLPIRKFFSLDISYSRFFQPELFHPTYFPPGNARYENFHTDNSYSDISHSDNFPIELSRSDISKITTCRPSSPLKRAQIEFWSQKMRQFSGGSADLSWTGPGHLPQRNSPLRQFPPGHFPLQKCLARHC